MHLWLHRKSLEKSNIPVTWWGQQMQGGFVLGNSFFFYFYKSLTWSAPHAVVYKYHTWGLTKDQWNLIWQQTPETISKMTERRYLKHTMFIPPFNICIRPLLNSQKYSSLISSTVLMSWFTWCRRTMAAMVAKDKPPFAHLFGRHFYACFLFIIPSQALLSYF